ncbi:Abi family protein [Nocardioides sp.]|uniref:Abi family protein n=1 Tax=Nocardioides sp. TaxID=35761 RepID=UPI002639D015|nr:Abi family protein [Nocardioides sp.]
MSDDVKAYRTYSEQVALLTERGMNVGDRDQAISVLRRINYYRLSGYWYPFRQLTDGTRGDHFYAGTHLKDVVALYEFDVRLRAATFSVLSPIELTLRALLGHELGKIDPCAHLTPELLGPTARRGSAYATWLTKYERELNRSREDFVAHHRQRYGGRLPVWAAVELLDWGGLTHLYGLSPRDVQDRVASACGLTGPQLTSWLKSLNLVRNACAHHGRLFNRVHTITPRLPRAGTYPHLDGATTAWGRTFGQLTLIQFLLDQLSLGRMRLLPAVVTTFPQVTAVPLTHIGADSTWQSASRLWVP